jgi:2-polyprenyl-3-methyl-5-hydroxy-6-metoxy-1,4-benzoquinol methylase
MNTNQLSEFDNRAGDWDKNQMHIRRSEAIATELINRVPLTKNMTALEFGAGTGLLSFILKDHFTEIIMIDNSQEMVRVTESKITVSGNQNMKALWIDLENDDFTGQYDIVYTQMVLHHVDNIDLIFSKFKTLIKPGGYLAIADLYSEDGSFHGDRFTGHKGFDTDQLTRQLEVIGFGNIVIKPCFIIHRENEKAEFQDYPVFLLTANRF